MPRTLCALAFFLGTIANFVASPPPASADPRSELLQMRKRFSRLSFWEARWGPGKEVMITDYAAPDSFRQTMTGVPSTIATYVIGSHVYYAPIYKGFSFSADAARDAIVQREVRTPSRLLQLPDIRRIRALGASSIDGVQTQGYSFDEVADGRRSHVTLYVGKADGLPHRLLVGDETNKAGALTVTFSQFNVPQLIAVPDK